MYKANIFCHQCNGACCRHCGCHLSPFDYSLGQIEQMVQSGLLHVGGAETEGEVLFLRVRNLNEPIAGARVFGPCVIFKDGEGCRFADENRPKGGRELEPSDGLSPCTQHYSWEKLIEDWLPHQDYLRYLAEKYWMDDRPVQI